MIAEEMIGIRYRVLGDQDTFLSLQLVNKLLNLIRRRYLVVLTMYDQAGRRAGARNEKS